MIVFVFVSACLLSFVSSGEFSGEPVVGARPAYDHQVENYTGFLGPALLWNFSFAVTPYFSPDHSVMAEVELILSAGESIDIMIPGFSSWVWCSSPPNRTVKCIGCESSYIREHETFTVFQALLNAVMRGIRVRILTNDYGDELCPGLMDPLVFLQLAGAEVKFFRTVSFLHDKFLAVDGRNFAVSSINYSWTSFMRNREAGLAFNDPHGLIAAFFQKVFEYDWEKGYSLTPPHYTPQQMAPVLNKTQIPVTIPVIQHFSCDIDSPFKQVLVEQGELAFMVSPDFAYYDFLTGLKRSKSSLDVYIYQITDDAIADMLIGLNNRSGFELNVMVSCAIYGATDRKLAVPIYRRLTEAGITLRMPPLGCFSYTHQKFWIVDKRVIWLSSGNWSPPDMPAPPYFFPAYDQDPNAWRKVNRDMHVRLDARTQGSELVEVFLSVIKNDWDQGFDYDPDKMEDDFLKRVSCSN